MDILNSNLPLVSIITPSFNQGRFIEETILSVLRQDYKNIEYIIIDGGSNDNTLDILKKNNDNISYWISEKDKGQSEAIIKGLNVSKGKYITWLCSDDILEPSAVSKQVEFLESNKKIGMVYGDRTRIDAIGNIIGFSKQPKFRKFLLKIGYAIPQETVLIRRSVYNNTDGLNENLNMAMDFDLWCKISKVSKIGHIPSFLGRFRSHKMNKSTIFSHELKSSSFKKGFPNEFLDVYKKHFNHRLIKQLYFKQKLIGRMFYLIDKIN